jgi:integrase
VTVRAGQGQKDRVTYLAAGGADALANRLAVRGREPGALLCPVDEAGRVAIRHRTPQAVPTILRRLAKRASVSSFSPHDLRRSFVSDLLVLDLAVRQRAGWGPLERLHAAAGTHTVPVLVTSAAPHRLAQAEAAGVRFGGDRFPVKPLDLEALLAAGRTLTGGP